MPNRDGTGPEGEGTRSGRKLGNCRKVTDNAKQQLYGKGMGKNRNSGSGEGKGNCLKRNKQ